MWVLFYRSRSSLRHRTVDPITLLKGREGPTTILLKFLKFNFLKLLEKKIYTNALTYGEVTSGEAAASPFLPLLSSFKAPQPKAIQDFTTQREKQNPPNAPKTPQNLLLPCDPLNRSRSLPRAFCSWHTALPTLADSQSLCICHSISQKNLRFLPGPFTHFLQV